MMTKQPTRRIAGHRITWYVYAGAHGEQPQKLRHAANMRGSWIGWDAACECGWESRTGGAIKASVERDVRSHKYDVTDDWRML